MTSFFNWFAQVGSVTGFGIRTIPERKGSSLAAVFGIAGVVAVFVGVLSIGQGFRAVMTSSAAEDGAIVMRGGADSEMMSALSREDTRIINDAAGIARTEDGALASAELFVVINIPKRSTGTDANVPLRGVEPAAFKVRNALSITEGRVFEWGKNEVIAGVGAVAEFAGLAVGDRIQVGQDRWTVTGHFTAGGGMAESEIWTDAGVLQSAYRRGNTFQSVQVKLDSPDSFQTFKDHLSADPRLNVQVMLLGDYYAEQSEMLYQLITGLGTLIAALMGLGAVFGALNTMYTAVSSRTKEIATLRALGFRGGPVVISVLLEALVLALVGGTIGGLSAFFAFDGFRTATLNWSSFSQVTFAFEVTPQLLTQGIVYAAMIGLVGGLFPAVRAIRQPISLTLREL